MKEMLSPALIWFLVGFVLVLMEFAAPGLVIFFFGAGAWVVCIMCLIADVSLNVQLLVFLVTSILLLAFLRKWVGSVFMGRLLKRGGECPDMEEFVGERAVAASVIKPNYPGKVEFRGALWKAESDEIIEECEPVEIVDQNNITLIVKPKRS